MARTTPLPATPPRPSRLVALAAAALAVAALGACVTRPASPSSPSSSAAASDSTTTGTVVTLHQEGGLAGLVTDATVDGAAHHFQTVTRHACGAEGASCPPPTDSATGTLSDSLATAIARAVDAADFFALQKDYGTNPRLRDGFLYVVTVRRGARTMTVRADDSTRPQALATLTTEMARVIDRARGRK